MELLKHLPFMLCTVPQVEAEIQRGIAAGKIPAEPLDWLQILELSDTEQRIFSKYNSFLGAGESAALAVCQVRGLRLATDDFSARQIAAQLRIPLTGTVGLLMFAVKNELVKLEEADHWLQQMIAKGYRAPISSLIEINNGV